MDELSLWELRAAVEGYKAAHSTEETVKPPTPEEHDEMVRKYG